MGFQPRMPFKTEIEPPSDSHPILDNRKKLIYFGLQKGGFGVLNLENRKLEFQDEINNRLILTALTLCTGQWGLQYKDMNTLYFGTRRCSTIRVPSQHNPDRTQTKCIDEMVRYDLDAADIVWATELDSTAAAGAPIIDRWGQVLFSSEDGKTYSLNAVTGEEVWSQQTGKEVLHGIAISEDFQEPRCAGSTIHFMDELVMMERIMADMFDDEPGFEQTTEFDRKKAKENLEGVRDEEEEEMEEEAEQPNIEQPREEL